MAGRQRYLHDVAVAAADLKAATAASGNSSIGASLNTLSAALPVYTGYVAFNAVFDELPGEPAPKLALVVDDVRRQQLTVEILRAALHWCSSEPRPEGRPILGCEPNARAVRFGLERSYRALDRLTPDEARRIELVDMANTIRPGTLT
jgi:Protein kinase G tetratricopeptide repeat